MNIKPKVIFIFIVTFCAILALTNCSGRQKNQKPDNKPEDTVKKSELIIFHSNNLNKQLEEVIGEFNKVYPQIRVTAEAATISKTVKKITEQNRVCDIFILSDYNQLDRFLIPTYAGWSIAFAGNEMVIAFTDKSKKSKEITEKNWYKILLDKNIRYGRADKDSDVCGTRTVLMMKLAEKFYNQQGLAERFAEKDKQFILTKLGGLLPLLNMNEIDYIFTFKSFAVMHQLKYISLPVEINFSSLDHLFDYAKATMEKKGKNKAKGRDVVGSPLLYGMTIPLKVNNHENALLFADFLLNPEKGLKLLEKSGNNIKSPIPTPYFDKIPPQIRKYVILFEPQANMPKSKGKTNPTQPPK